MKESDQKRIDRQWRIGLMVILSILALNVAVISYELNMYLSVGSTICVLALCLHDLWKLNLQRIRDE